MYETNFQEEAKHQWIFETEKKGGSSFPHELTSDKACSQPATGQQFSAVGISSFG